MNEETTHWHLQMRCLATQGWLPIEYGCLGAVVIGGGSLLAFFLSPLMGKIVAAVAIALAVISFLGLLVVKFRNLRPGMVPVLHVRSICPVVQGKPVEIVTNATAPIGDRIARVSLQLHVEEYGADSDGQWTRRHTAQMADEQVVLEGNDIRYSCVFNGTESLPKVERTSYKDGARWVLSATVSCSSGKVWLGDGFPPYGRSAWNEALHS